MKYCGIIPRQMLPEVLHFYMQWENNTEVLVSLVSKHTIKGKLNSLPKGPVMVICSEFGCTHEDISLEVAENLVNHLSQDFDDTNKHFIEGCILGLQNVSGKSILSYIYFAHSLETEFSNDLFKNICNKLSASNIPSEGEICAFIFMMKSIADVCPGKATELLKKYIPHITNPRHTSTKRLWILQLTGQFLALLTQRHQLLTWVVSLLFTSGAVSDEYK
jgi:hypothetical protein